MGNDTSGLGGTLQGVFGGDADEFQPYSSPTNSSYVYRGQGAGAYQTTANAAAATGSIGQDRKAAQANYGNANQAAQTAANYQAGAQNAGLAAQQGAVGMLSNAAAGNTPSAADIQQQQGVDAAVRSQQALAAGARGSAGLASAQYNAGQNTANVQQTAVDQGAQLRAQEQATARQAYAGAAQGLSGAAANAVQGAQSEQQLQANQAQYQSTNQAQQMAQNDAFQQNQNQYALGLGSLAQNAASATQQGSEAEYAQNSANYNAAMSADAGIREQNAQNNTSSGNNVVSTIGDVVGHII